MSLTVTRQDGQQAATSQKIQFRDLLIASLGDSAASGEGDPDVPSATNPQWANDTDAKQCDRSGWAASAQAAFQIQNEDPGTSVTFWHLACSGSPISGGLLPGTNGSVWQGPNAPNGSTLIQAQVPELAGLVQQAGRPVDALLITAGADDVNWTTTVKACYIQNVVALGLGPITQAVEIALSAAGLSPCIKATEGAVQTNLSNLGGIVHQLAAALQQTAPGETPIAASPNHVFLTEYWDPTVDNRNGIIYRGFSSAGPGFSWYCEQDPIAPDAADRAYGHYSLVDPLNNTLMTAAAHEGWHWVGGIATQFTGGDPAAPGYSPSGHGVCASPRNNWVNTLEDSLAVEASINGSWHANQKGQGVVESQIMAALTPFLALNQPPSPPEVAGLAVDTTDTPTQSLFDACTGPACPPDSPVGIVPGSTVVLSGLVDGIVNYAGSTTVQFTTSAGSVSPTAPVQANGYSGSFSGILKAPLTAGVINATATATNGGGTSPPESISIPVEPEVTSISPDRGVATGRTLVTVTGAGFGPGTRVYFGSTPATNVRVRSSTKLTALSPRSNGNTSVFVSVTSGGLSSGPLVESDLNGAGLGSAPDYQDEFDYFIPWVPVLSAGSDSCGGGASVEATVWGPPIASARAGPPEPNQNVQLTLAESNGHATSAVFGNHASQITSITGSDGTAGENVGHADLDTTVTAQNLSKPSSGAAHISLPVSAIPCVTAASAQAVWSVQNGVAATSVQAISPATAQKLGLPHVDNSTVDFQVPASARVLSGLRLSVTMPNASAAAALARSGIDAAVLSTNEELAQIGRVRGVQDTGAVPTRLTNATFVGPIFSVGALSGPASAFAAEARAASAAKPHAKGRAPDRRLLLILPYSAKAVKAGSIPGVFCLDTSLRPARWTNAGVQVKAVTSSTITAELPRLATCTVAATTLNIATGVVVTAGPFSKPRDGVATAVITAAVSDQSGSPISGLPLRFTTTGGSLRNLGVVSTNAQGKATDTLRLTAGAASVFASIVGLPTGMGGMTTVARTDTPAVRAAPRLSMVFPSSATIQQGLRQGIYITGSGFASATEVLIGNVVLHRQAACPLGGSGCFSVHGDSEIVADGGDLEPGTYDARVVGPHGESAATPNARVELTIG